MSQAEPNKVGPDKTADGFVPTERMERMRTVPTARDKDDPVRAERREQAGRIFKRLHRRGTITRGLADMYLVHG